jgi:Tol biopolymer transport system component
MGAERRLHRVPLDGPAVPLPHDGPQLSPEYSADGVWIYYSANDCGIRRVRVDGSAPPEAVGAGAGCATEPSLSPDGRTLAFARLPPAAEPGIYLLDLASGEETLLAPDGRTPRWSPGGDRVAYFQDGLWVSQLDGTVPLQLGDYETRLNFLAGELRPTLSWSPDGVWLVVHATESGEGATPRLYLMLASRGVVLPLAFTRGIHGAAWRP